MKCVKYDKDNYISKIEGSTMKSVKLPTSTMKTVVKLPKFRKGKYSFCREKKCNLQGELRDGDPAHQDCWLCIVDHYSKWPKLSGLCSLNQIIQLRKSNGFKGID
jgi:hypothetical protein